MPGYRPGLIADIVRLHAEYYARDWGFGLPFEAKVAGELSAFMRDFRPGLDFFAAQDDDNGRLLGTISLEGPTSTEPLAHLRWFITSDGARGTGLGRRLMDQAIAHVDSKGFPGVYLTTFAGLGPARHLYESFGFALVAEAERDQWSGGVREQRFERHSPDART
jgi:GNAT superfamily N-acetyltransferase